LVLKQVSLQGTEELGGLRKGQPERLEAVVILFQGDTAVTVSACPSSLYRTS
jgi:hypothetical protein